MLLELNSGKTFWSSFQWWIFNVYGSVKICSLVNKELFWLTPVLPVRDIVAISILNVRYWNYIQFSYLTETYFQLNSLKKCLELYFIRQSDSTWLMFVCSKEMIDIIWAQVRFFIPNLIGVSLIEYTKNGFHWIL